MYNGCTALSISPCYGQGAGVGVVQEIGGNKCFEVICRADQVRTRWRRVPTGLTMKYDPNKHHRRSIRLKGYDYTQPGAYFVTICTYQRQVLFGEIINGEMVLNTCGEIVSEEWFKTTQIRANIQLHDDEFVIMPNHLHGIIWIVETEAGATGPVAPTRNGQFNGPKPGSIGAIIGQIKSVAAKRINQTLNSPGAPVWQRNYFEHIVRNDDELNAIRQYIQNNPHKWELDQDNPIDIMTGEDVPK